MLGKEDSVTYGVKFSSSLNDLDNFHVIEQLPQDIMHVLVEGVDSLRTFTDVSMLLYD